MRLNLLPFPEFFHPLGKVVSELPLTREGVKEIPASLLQQSPPNVFASIDMHDPDGSNPCRGLCGLLSATAFLDGSVKPHEETLSGRLVRQRALVKKDGGALGKPVLLTCRDLSKVWEQLTDHYESGEEHVLFPGYDTTYQLQSYSPKRTAANHKLDLSSINTLVIADGHHRAKTHAQLAAEGREDCAFIPVCIVPSSELSCGVFLRSIADFDGELSQLVEQLAPYFEVLPLATPFAPLVSGKWLMAYRGQYFSLRRRVDDPSFHTEAAWMVGVVLRDLFGIMDPRTDERLENKPVSVLRNGELEIEDTEVLSFTGSPVSEESFFREVNAGRIFPPKSTRFMPKVPSGLVVWKGGPPV